ncbi:MAG TPA: VOC family protein [Acidobacteriaceae bacterium]|jgi:lactoylglutathione lyase
MPPKRPLRLAAFALTCVTAALGSSTASAQKTSNMPPRPHITGISHVGYFVSDLPKALVFWHDLLGFDEYFSIKKTDSNDVRIAFLKINDRQHVELFNEPSTHPPNMLSHVCFAVDDIEAMRKYLAANGIKVPAATGNKTRAGDYAFEITDPDGMLVEFVQSLPTGAEAQAKGKFMPATRIATHIYHTGFVVGNAQRSMDFYGKLLGFKETWRGGGDPKVLSWINMRVPDGEDYVEFMLYSKPPDNAASFGGKNHLALDVPDIAKATEILRARAAATQYTKELKITTGVNQKRQMNLYDPDGTRVELMEPFTITGKPTPPSTAPPPPPAHD